MPSSRGRSSFASSLASSATNSEIAIAQPKTVGRDHTHIELIDVKCDNKNGIIVTINFEDTFNGVVYSQGYYNDPKCRLVILSLLF